MRDEGRALKRPLHPSSFIPRRTPSLTVELLPFSYATRRDNFPDGLPRLHRRAAVRAFGARRGALPAARAAGLRRARAQGDRRVGQEDRRDARKLPRRVAAIET